LSSSFVLAKLNLIVFLTRDDDRSRDKASSAEKPPVVDEGRVPRVLPLLSGFSVVNESGGCDVSFALGIPDYFGAAVFKTLAATKFCSDILQMDFLTKNFLGKIYFLQANMSSVS
jgi:hypothetical protein